MSYFDSTCNSDPTRRECGTRHVSYLCRVLIYTTIYFMYFNGGPTFNTVNHTHIKWRCTADVYIPLSYLTCKHFFYFTPLEVNNCYTIWVKIHLLRGFRRCYLLVGINLVHSGICNISEIHLIRYDNIMSVFIQTF